MIYLEHLRPLNARYSICPGIETSSKDDDLTESTLINGVDQRIVDKSGPSNAGGPSPGPFHIYVTRDHQTNQSACERTERPTDRTKKGNDKLNGH